MICITTKGKIGSRIDKFVRFGMVRGNLGMCHWGSETAESCGGGCDMRLDLASVSITIEIIDVKMR